MSKHRRLLSDTGGMALVTLVSRLSGLVRDKAVAFFFGAGLVGDAFVTGFRIPNMFRALLAEGSLHASFIPVLSELKGKGEEARAREFVRAMTTVLLVVLPVVVVLAAIAAPLLVRLVAAPFEDSNPDTFKLAVTLSRVMLPYLAFISLAALAQGVLNASGRFLLPAATPIALSLSIALGAMVAVVVFGGDPLWLGVGVLVGGFAQFAMQLGACRRVGLPLMPGRQAFSNPDVRQTLRLMLPGVPALGIYQITILLSNRLAAGVGEGAVFCTYNASRINELVYGVVIVQLTTAVLPMIAAQRSGDADEARGTLAFALRLLSLVALPATVFSVVLATPLVGALFGGGKYGPLEVQMAASALVMYSLGMPFLGLAKLLANTSFAWKDTRSPLISAAVNLAAFVTLGFAFTPRFGVAGLAGATSAGQLANTLTLFWLNGRAGRLPRLLPLVPAVARHLLAAGALGATVSIAAQLIPIPLSTGVRSIATLGVITVLGGGAYALVLMLVRAPEWRELIALVKGKLGR
jgi:putative peptidoglycan lipid II flippase